MYSLFVMVLLSAPAPPVRPPMPGPGTEQWQQARIQQVLKARKTMGKGRDTVPRKAAGSDAAPADGSPEPEVEAGPDPAPGQTGQTGVVEGLQVGSVHHGWGEVADTGAVAIDIVTGSAIQAEYGLGLADAVALCLP